MFAKKLFVITCGLAGWGASPYATSQRPLVMSILVEDRGLQGSEPMEKITLEYPKGEFSPQKFQRLMECYMKHASEIEAFVLSLSSPQSESSCLRLIIPPEKGEHHGKKALEVVDSIEQLWDEMVSTISEGVGIAAIFPQQKEDLIKIDDVKRNKFVSLAHWILQVIKPELVGPLKDKMLQSEQAFIKLVNENWGEGIYTSCVEDFDPDPASYEIPSAVLDGCTVGTILSTPPDFFPSDADNGFKKLIPVIRMVSPYVSEVAKGPLELLKKSIKIAVQKYTPRAINNTLADHSKEEIQSSAEHFNPWLVLAGTL